MYYVNDGSSGSNEPTNTGGTVVVATMLEAGGSGGKGIVILRFPSAFSITIGSGLTCSNANTTVGTDKIAQLLPVVVT